MRHPAASVTIECQWGGPQAACVTLSRDVLAHMESYGRLPHWTYGCSHWTFAADRTDLAGAAAVG